MSALILALVAGGAVGLALGALGGGGSVLAVPALIYLLGFTPAAATTASLVIVTVTSATALFAHAREGTVRWGAGALFASAGLVPAALGGAMAGHLPSALLTGAFALIAGLAALRMLRPPATVPAEAAQPSATVPDAAPRASAAVPDTAPRTSAAVPDAAPQTSTAVPDPAPPSSAPPPPRPRRIAGAGAGLGAVTGVLGVGGGFLAVPALVSVVGLRMRAAVGTSLLVITVNSLAALAARAGAAEKLDWAVVAPFAGAAILGAWDGKRLAGRVSGGTLQRIFACVLLAVAACMLLDVVL